MIRSLVSFCLLRRAIIIIALCAFCAAGILAFQKLNIEAYPNPTPVIMEITAQAPGLSAEEMERYYTTPIEIGLYSTPGIDVIRSTSFYGLSFVRVLFKYGVDYHFAYSQTAIALQQNVSLPGNQIPQIQQNSATGEILRYQLSGPKHFGLSNLRTLQDWVVARRLSTIPGIVQINSWGGTTKQFEVQVDPLKLQSFNLSFPQILTALGNANINVGGREIRLGQQSINIRGIGLIDDGGGDDLTRGIRLDDIEKVVLSQNNGVPVLVRDVAKVNVGYVPRLGICGRDHEDDVVAAIVVMSRTGKTAEMLPVVKTAIDKMNHDGSLPPGIKIETFYDRGTLTAVTTHTVLHNLLFGCLLVFLIQWVFLGDLRSALIVGASIPFALFFAVIMLVLMGESANLLSIGAVDLGIIVDFAVILVENIFRNLQKKPSDQQAMLIGLSEGAYGPDPTKQLEPALVPGWNVRLKMLLVSALQVDNAVFFSALITVAGFVPLFTMEGVEGQIFGPMARTYGYALVGALLSAFTVSPVLASLLLPEMVEEKETVIVRYLHHLYQPVLKFSLMHRRLVVGLGLGFLVLAGWCGSRLGSEFLPHLEEGNFWIRASMPMTISLQDGEAATRKMREILLRHPEVITVVSQHGRPDNGSDASPFSNVELFVPLKPREAWTPGLTKDKLTELVQSEFNSALPGVNFNFSQYIQDNIEESISGVKGANSVKIIGPDLTMLEKIAAQVRDEMSKIPGVADLGIFPLLGQPNLNIKVNRAKAARYGVNTGDVTTVIQTALGGSSASTVLEGDRQFGLVVRLAPECRDTIEKISNVKVACPILSGNNSSSNPTYAYIPLKELADISLDTGASWIYHESTERFIPVKFSVRGRDLGGTVAEAQKAIEKKVKLPSGYRMVWSGEFGDLQEAQARLGLIVPVSLLLIVGLLYCLFNSFHECALTFIGVLFAVAGGVLALSVTGLNFSISAAVGFISLLGVSVMNGILLLTYFSQTRTGHPQSAREAMLHAASTQMRPLIMTSLSACIGLLPAALSTGIGSQVQRPLATVIVGGMFVGPLLILFVMPALKLICLDYIGDKSTTPEHSAAAP